jgi:hypothetical protein
MQFNSIWYKGQAIKTIWYKGETVWRSGASWRLTNNSDSSSRSVYNGDNISVNLNVYYYLKSSSGTVINAYSNITNSSVVYVGVSNGMVSFTKRTAGVTVTITAKDSEGNVLQFTV